MPIIQYWENEIFVEVGLNESLEGFDEKNQITFNIIKFLYPNNKLHF